MAQIIRINTRGKTHTSETPSDELTALGGRGLTSKIVLDEVPAKCHALGRDNKLVIAPGLLSGTPATNSGRLSVGAKSPLTGGIKESNAGGTVSQKLARLGIKALVLENRPESIDDWSVVVVTKEGVTIEPAGAYAGMGTNKTITALQEKYGNKTGVMCIGPAGEQRLTAASIQVADPAGRPGRAAGRGGLGAVLGSKGIKAIVVDDQGADKVAIADLDGFKTANRAWTKLITDHPVSGQALGEYGTAVLVNIINNAGALPTKNFRSGHFDHAGDISGEKINELIKQRKGIVKEGCHPGCVIKCSQCYNDQDGKVITSGFEYETIWAFGAHTLIHDLDAVARLDALCDDAGVDTIDTGVALGLAMEAGILDWGDSKKAIELVSKIGTDDPMGRILGSGAAFAGQAFGVDRVPVVKKQAIPAYDPRAVKGVGITYATSPQGADHTSGYAVTANILGVGGSVDPLKKDGQIDLSKNLQIATAAIDATGLCLFVAFPVLDSDDGVPLIVDMINAQYGLALTPDDVVSLGISILDNENRFNKMAGFTEKDDHLPELFLEDFEPHHVTWDFSSEEIQQAKVSA
ncbi:MAG: aldehyde ferredoxin oxidoreductase C-terminal domain-containing protein [Desulfobacteraceae bacterium]